MSCREEPGWAWLSTRPFRKAACQRLSSPEYFFIQGAPFSRVWPASLTCLNLSSLCPLPGFMFLVAFVFLNLELSIPTIAPLQSSGTHVCGFLLLFLGWPWGWSFLGVPHTLLDQKPRLFLLNNISGEEGTNLRGSRFASAPSCGEEALELSKSVACSSLQSWHSARLRGFPKSGTSVWS